MCAIQGVLSFFMNFTTEGTLLKASNFKMKKKLHMEKNMINVKKNFNQCCLLDFYVFDWLDIFLSCNTRIATVLYLNIIMSCC